MAFAVIIAAMPSPSQSQRLVDIWEDAMMEWGWGHAALLKRNVDVVVAKVKCELVKM